jgi:hypothetical protein
MLALISTSCRTQAGCAGQLRAAAATRREDQDLFDLVHAAGEGSARLQSAGWRSKLTAIFDDGPGARLERAIAALIDG